MGLAANAQAKLKVTVIRALEDRHHLVEGVKTLAEELVTLPSKVTVKSDELPSVIASGVGWARSTP